MEALAPGQDTATAVLEMIQSNPQRHDQTEWIRRDGDEDDSGCGTTYCVAGWALHVHGFNDDWIDWARSVLAPMPDVHIPRVSDTAQKLLGLSSRDAKILFYRTTNAEALLALEWLAAGKQLKWQEILSPKSLERLDHFGPYLEE